MIRLEAVVLGAAVCRSRTREVRRQPRAGRGHIAVGQGMPRRLNVNGHVRPRALEQTRELFCLRGRHDRITLPRGDEHRGSAEVRQGRRNERYHRPK